MICVSHLKFRTNLHTDFHFNETQQDVFLLACGATTGTCSGQTVAADSSETHEVRCCSDTDLGSGWTQMTTRGAACLNVWGRSEDINGICQNALNYGEALTMCANLGGRLCTTEELLADCADGSGCMFNHELIWSSPDVSNMVRLASFKLYVYLICVFSIFYLFISPKLT